MYVGRCDASHYFSSFQLPGQAVAALLEDDHPRGASFYHHLGDPDTYLSHSGKVFSVLFLSYFFL